MSIRKSQGRKFRKKPGEPKKKQVTSTLTPAEMRQRLRGIYHDTKPR